MVVPLGVLYDFLKVLPDLEIYGIDISQYAIDNSKNEIRDNARKSQPLISFLNHLEVFGDKVPDWKEPKNKASDMTLLSFPREIVDSLHQKSFC